MSEPTPATNPVREPAPQESAVAASVPPEVVGAPPAARFGKFVRTRKVGAGGMGEVWKAWDTQLSRWVALKFLKGGDEAELARFRREAQVAATLSHPNIAAIYEVGEDQGQHFIAMQYVEGRTLKGFPRGDRRTLARLVRDAARAVQYAHERGVVHRDIKPDNLMAASRGHVYVMDFGLARPLRGSSLSASGLMVGTPAYMSPEQARGERVDHRADVYSLGATLYELLKGRPPFSGDSALETALKVTQDEPEPVQGELGVIVAKAMEKDPARRYPTAAALADDLERWLNGEPILARPPSVAYRLRKRLARRLPVTLTAAVGLAAVVATVAVLLPRWMQAERQVDREVEERRRALEAAAWARPHLDRGREFMREMERLLTRDRLDAKELDLAGTRAREEFSKALAVDPRCAEAHLEEARTWRLQEKDAPALEACARAIATDERLATAYLERARILLEQYEAMRHESGGSRPETERAREAWTQIEADLSRVRSWSGGGEELELAGAIKAFAEGRFAEAGEGLDGYARGHPGDAVAWSLAGHAWLHAERGERADEALTRAIELRRTSRTFWGLRAIVRVELLRYAEAEADFARAIALNPDDAWVFNQRGTLRLRQGRHQEAESDYSRSIRLNPRSAEAHYNRGYVRSALNRHMEAAADLTRAIELRRGNVAALVCRGNAYHAMGRHEEAEADFARAIEIDPRHAPAWVGRGNLCHDLRRFAEAEAAYTRALEIDPRRVPALVGRGNVHRALRRPGEAESDYNRAIDLAPTLWQAYFNRGGLRMDEGQWAGAVKDFEEVLRLAPAMEETIRPLLARARRQMEQ